MGSMVLGRGSLFSFQGGFQSIIFGPWGLYNEPYDHGFQLAHGLVGLLVPRF